MRSTSEPHKSDPACSQSLLETIRQLTTAHPGVPFLALGQTVFWDEPVKAVVRSALDQVSYPTPLILAVHDTDYFARPHSTLASTHPYIILSHNDGSTRGLWSAAGELSQLFGAETVPGRAALRAAGVRLDIAARAREESILTLIDRVTEAWGWRGVVQTSGVETLTHEVPLQEVLPTLRALLKWGFGGSAASMCHCTGTEAADAAAFRIEAALQKAAEDHPGGSLSDLYQTLFPFMLSLLAGGDHGPTAISHSLAESRFSPATASRPRFRIVDLFLRPESRAVCLQAYNNAVRGSEIYSLDRFGEDSIPFDVVIPGSGRGTLRITEAGVYVEGRRQEFLPTSGRIESVKALAELLADRFGEQVHLVGKAITWIAIMAAEFMFVFHEGASSYTRRTRQMLDEMRSHGVTLNIHPILRIRYNTWDALAVVPSGFCLPDHYAEAFGHREISAQEFAARWREVMDAQESLLLRLGQLRRPLDLLYFLEERQDDHSTPRWGELRQRYEEARGVVRAANAHSAAGVREIYENREARYHCGIEIDRRQRQLGEIRRRRLADEAENAAGLSQQYQEIQSEITRLHREREALARQRAALKDQLRTPRTSAEYQSALAAIKEIEAEAELERIRIARNAYLVSHSLEETNRRPTGWWLPMVSPDGSWFHEICRTAKAYVEAL